MNTEAQPTTRTVTKSDTTTAHRLSSPRSRGKTTTAPKWNRAQRRAFLTMVRHEGEQRMRETRTAVRITKRRVKAGHSLRAATRWRARPTFDWGTVVRASHRAGWPEVV